MTPRLDPKRIPVSTGIRRSPNVSSTRCLTCGLKLHVELTRRGIHEHVLCTAMPAGAYDALLARPHLSVVKGLEPDLDAPIDLWPTKEARTKH